MTKCPNVEPTPTPFAVSALHLAFSENKKLVEEIRPETEDDWLIVVGGIVENPADLAWAPHTLHGRFARVVWTPGNHEMLT